VKAIARKDHRGLLQRSELRYLRAATTFTEAAALARALPRGGDSLIVARMLAEQAWSLLSLAQIMLSTEGGAPPPGNEGADALKCFLQALPLLSSAADIIRQRRAAGTLLRRTCRAEEAAEFQFAVSRGKAWPADDDGLDHLRQARLQTYGEDTLFLAGSYALVALGVFAQELSGTPASGRIMDCVALVQDACSLLALPRDGPPLGLTDQEIYFARRCRTVLEGLFCSDAHVALLCSRPDVWPIVAPLQQQWLQLHRCPAFLRAVSDRVQQSYANGVVEWEIRLRNEAAEQQKRSCAQCGVAEAVRGDFKTCKRCHSIYFCRNEHQVAHWKTHKKTCVKRKE
jgi:hypothetical protein